MAQGVTSNGLGFARVQHQVPQALEGPGLQAGWPRGGWKGSPSSPEPTSPVSQAPLGAATSCLPSPGLSLERTEVTTGYVTVSVLWGKQVVPCVSTMPDWKE